MTLLKAEVICDSINGGVRLTTFVLTYPRFIHGEVMTHRAFSRNAASSRAIPVRKMLGAVWREPVVPVAFGANRSGMQAGDALAGWRLAAAHKLWLSVRLPAIAAAWLFSKIGLHKQVANRILEPWQWMTTIVTSTEEGYKHFFSLRDHKDAQPEICELAKKMKSGLDGSSPTLRNYHIPFLNFEELTLALSANTNASLDYIGAKTFRKLAMLSAARCCRVSYNNVDGSKSNIVNDMELADRLRSHRPLHASPFEHQAYVSDNWSVENGVRNFKAPWIQYRAIVEFEDA